jgi:hypothetical protein
MNAAPGRKDRLRSSLQATQLSSRLPSFDMAVARDGFWGYHHLALLRLVPKLSHVGGCCGSTSLPSALAYELWVTGQGTESSDGCYPILSPSESRSVFKLSFKGDVEPHED